MVSVEEELKFTCIKKLQENQNKIHACINKLSEDELWWRPNPESNSMGNILLHLCGNITQYILSGLGGADDHRKRSAEFEAQGPLSKSALLTKLDQILEQVYLVINHCSEEDLLATRHVQVYDISGIHILIHVTEHFSYHTGQIVYFTKWKHQESMHFYDNEKLEGKGK